MNQTLEAINVAPSSTEGHYVHTKSQENVIEIDNISEVFKVNGPSTLSAKKHTTLKMQESCLITCQVVYDPFAQGFRRSKD